MSTQCREYHNDIDSCATITSLEAPWTCVPDIVSFISQFISCLISFIHVFSLNYSDLATMLILIMNATKWLSMIHCNFILSFLFDALLFTADSIDYRVNTDKYVNYGLVLCWERRGWWEKENKSTKAWITSLLCALHFSMGIHFHISQYLYIEYRAVNIKWVPNLKT